MRMVDSIGMKGHFAVEISNCVNGSKIVTLHCKTSHNGDQVRMGWDGATVDSIEESDK
jgi:hypothetical protein